MAAKSFGSFGAYKYKYLEETKNKPKDGPIDVSNLNHTTLKDIEYFQKNSSKPSSNQIVNYTWEKPTDESPSFYPKLDELKDSSLFNNSAYQNTLDLMATYKGIPHIAKQNKWETEPSQPPKLLSYPQKRRAATLSSMSQYVEEMNKTFPGESMY